MTLFVGRWQVVWMGWKWAASWPPLGYRRFGKTSVFRSFFKCALFVGPFSFRRWHG
jgi:hypothetical protein